MTLYSIYISDLLLIFLNDQGFFLIIDLFVNRNTANALTDILILKADLISIDNYTLTLSCTLGHIIDVGRMLVLDIAVDGSNPGSISMLCP